MHSKDFEIPFAENLHGSKIIKKYEGGLTMYQKY